MGNTTEALAILISVLGCVLMIIFCLLALDFRREMKKKIELVDLQIVNEKLTNDIAEITARRVKNLDKNLEHGD